MADKVRYNCPRCGATIEVEKRKEMKVKRTGDVILVSQCPNQNCKVVSQLRKGPGGTTSVEMIP